MVYAQTRILHDNEMHKILWDFKMQTDHLIPARRPNLKVICKKTLQSLWVTDGKLKKAKK